MKRRFTPLCTSAAGLTLPTWTMQQVGCYRRYTGRDANVVATAALDPKPPINGEDKIYSALMLAALMIRRHFSISAFCLSAARTGDRGGAPKGGGQKRRFHVHV